MRAERPKKGDIVVFVRFADDSSMRSHARAAKVQEKHVKAARAAWDAWWNGIHPASEAIPATEETKLTGEELHALESAFTAFDKSPQTRSLARTIGALITRVRGGYCRDEDCTCATQLGFRACASPVSGIPRTENEPVRWWNEAGLSGPFTPTPDGGNDGFVRDARGSIVADCQGYEARANVVASLLNRASVISSASPLSDDTRRLDWLESLGQCAIREGADGAEVAVCKHLVPIGIGGNLRAAIDRASSLTPLSAGCDL